MPGGDYDGNEPAGARGSAEQLCDALDDALLLIARSEHDGEAREALAELVSSALRAVYAALAVSSDAGAYRDALTVASLQIEEAMASAALMSEEPNLAEASVALSIANQIVSRGPIPARAWRLPSTAALGGRLPASVGTPRILDPGREVVAPIVPLAPHPVEPALERKVSTPARPIADLDELDELMAAAEALPAAGESKRVKVEPQAKRILGVSSASDALVRTARVLAEELGCLGGQRKPSSARGWWSNRRVEDRMLARVDAIVSCGEHAWPALVRGLENRPVPDPELTWALVLLFGALAGDDSVDEALRLARASDLAHPELRAAVIDALVLVPTTRVEARLRPWLGHSDEHRRSVAVSVLGRRSALMVDELAIAASDGCLAVVEAAAAAIATVPGAIAPEVLETLLHHPEESVASLALAGAVFARQPAGVARARGLVRAHRGDFARANIVYALCAGRATLDALLEDSAVGGGSRSLSALGWFGHVDAVPYLVGRLESDDATICAEASAALQRLTGLADPTAPEPLVFRLPAGTPSQDADSWRGWWSSVGQTLDPTVRYRLGAPWSARSNARELREASSSHAVRELCLLELRARVAVKTDLDTRTFVAKQLTSLGLLEEELRGSVLPQTGWPVTVQV